MQLDLRYPIGLMFGIIGVLLVGYGLLGDQSVYTVSLGVNVNLWAGLGMAIFGLLMLAGARRASRMAPR